MTTLIDDSATMPFNPANPADAEWHPWPDMARMRCWAEEQGVADELRALQRPSIGRSLTATLSDWLLIFGAFAAVVSGGAFLMPFAIILIGNRQRALGNLLHDASHGSFAGEGRQADLLADGLLFLPLCAMRTLPGRAPSADRGSLGGAGRDMDFSLLWRHMANARVWGGSILGAVRRADARSRALMLAWWGTVLLAIALILRPSDALLFAALWLGSRATSFHLITAFRDGSDHVVLRASPMIDVSRNKIVSALFGILFHPHDNGYQLARRLNPGIPFFALPRAHALLMRWPDYAAVADHEGYGFRADAVMRFWGRRPPFPLAARAHDEADQREPLGDAKHLIDLLYPEPAGE